MNSLQARLDRYKAESRAKQDPDIAQRLESGIAELRITHPASSHVQPGRLFPDFELMDSHGNAFSLKDQLVQGPVVLNFYRGFWCPYCNIELEALGKIHARLRELGAELIAISPQTQANSKRAIRNGDIPFRILADPGNRVAALAGLRYRLGDSLAATYKSLGVNLPLINGDDSWTLPIPARIVLTPEGRVHSVDADPDYTRRPEPMATLRTVERIAGGGGPRRETSMIYELREYHCVAGRLPALIERFKGHTTVIWRRLGIRPVAFFTTCVGPSSSRLTYLLAWDSLADRERIWSEFLADPEWLAVRSRTEASGPLVDFVENRLLQSCVMPPAF